MPWEMLLIKSHYSVITGAGTFAGLVVYNLHPFGATLWLLSGRIVAPLAVVPVVRKVPSRRCDPAGRLVVQLWVLIPLPFPLPPPFPPRAMASPANIIANITVKPITIICLDFIINFPYLP
jgi:hypothetical protein